MAKSYLEEYTEFIEDVQNKLLNIQLQYNEKQMQINADVILGLLSAEVGKRLTGIRMDKFIPSVDPKYVLSKEDTAFVSKYAALDENGQILSTILKPEYLEKQSLLQEIYRSIQIYSYLDSIGDKDARLNIKFALYEHYLEQKKSIEHKIEELIRIYGPSERKSTRCQRLVAEQEKIEKALRFIDGLETVSQEAFDKVVAQFYNIKKSYYEWFLKMQIKQEYEEATIYDKNITLMENISEVGNKVSFAGDTVTDLHLKLEDTHKALFSVLNEFAAINKEELTVEETKSWRSLFQRNEPTNNKSELFKLFVRLASIYGVSKFIEDNYSNNNNPINLNNVFEEYFQSKYTTGVTFVEPIDFLNDLRNTIVGYYQTTIEDLMYRISSSNITINSNSAVLCGNINVGIQNANVMKRIREEYPAKQEQLIIKGFSFTELERIYNDIKEYMGAGYNLGISDTKSLLRKV